MGAVLVSLRFQGVETLSRCGLSSLLVVRRCHSRCQRRWSRASCVRLCSPICAVTLCQKALVARRIRPSRAPADCQAWDVPLRRLANARCQAGGVAAFVGFAGISVDGGALAAGVTGVTVRAGVAARAGGSVTTGTVIVCASLATTLSAVGRVSATSTAPSPTELAALATLATGTGTAGRGVTGSGVMGRAAGAGAAGVGVAEGVGATEVAGGVDAIGAGSGCGSSRSAVAAPDPMLAGRDTRRAASCARA